MNHGPISSPPSATGAPQAHSGAVRLAFSRAGAGGPSAAAAARLSRLVLAAGALGLTSAVFSMLRLRALADHGHGPPGHRARPASELSGGERRGRRCRRPGGSGPFRGLPWARRSEPRGVVLVADHACDEITPVRPTRGCGGVQRCTSEGVLRGPGAPARVYLDWGARAARRACGRGRALARAWA